MAVLTAFTATVSAESVVVDLTVGGGVVTTDKKTAAFGDSSLVQVTNTLTAQDQSYVWAQFDHALPIIPNFRFESNTLSYTGTAQAGLGTFNGVSITADAASTVDLSNQDYIAYYGVPFSTWIPMIDEADFGIGVKQFSGKITVTGVADEALDAIMLPYLYAKLHISPPFLLGLGFEYEYKGLAGDGFSFTETIIKADWSVEAPIPVIDLEVGVEAGLRSTAIEYDASGSTAFLDLEFSGIFFGVFAKFGI